MQLGPLSTSSGYVQHDQVRNVSFLTLIFLSAFVKSDRPKSFPRLTVKHVPGRHPTIVLKDADGEEIEEMSIRKWDTDTIEEFLREHLS